MSFIKDFIYKPEQSSILESSLSGVFDLLKSNVDEVDRNSNISKLLTYKRIRFQRIDITNVTYTLSSLLNSSHIVSLIGGSRNTSMEKRLEIWNSMKALEQADILMMAGYYLELTDNVMSTITDDIRKRKFDVIDFELCDVGNNLLVRNIDYVFYDNKLVLLKEFFNDANYRKKYLFMKNIVIDYGLTEGTLGEFMHMPSNKEITKVEYNEILKGFTEAASKGPIIGEYGTALNRYKSLEGVRVYDKINADETRRHFWGNNDVMGDFTNFDFIVSMPVQLVYKPEKLDYIIKFFNSTKPAYANFIFLPELVETDTIAMKAKPTIFKTKGSMSGIKNTLKKKDSSANYFSRHFFMEDYLLNRRAKHHTIKMPMHRTLDVYNLFEKQTSTTYSLLEQIIDLIPQKTRVIGNLKVPFLDRAQIGKGLGGDSYRLDEDYFDTQSLSDPLWSRLFTDIFDFIGHNESSIKLVAIESIIDLMPMKEKHVKMLSAGMSDNVKIFNDYNDYTYISDENDYFDSLILYDNKNMLGAVSGLIDSIPDMYDSKIAKQGLLLSKENIKKINKVTGNLSISLNDILLNKSSFRYFDVTKSVIDNIPDIYDNVIIKNGTLSLSENINKINSITGNLNISLSDILLKKGSLKYFDVRKNMRDNIMSSQLLVMLYEKTLYDRIRNIDIANKTMLTTHLDKSTLTNKANILKCDSIFNCDYSDESCISFDSAPEEYSENENTDFVSRESIHLEFIPKQ